MTITDYLVLPTNEDENAHHTTVFTIIIILMENNTGVHNF